MILALLLAAGPSLLPGADGKLCLDCHAPMRPKLSKPFVHTPLKGGTCTGCHDPHASQHGAMLSAEPSKVCATCHTGVVPLWAKSVHAPAADGRCTACHDPHASDDRFELTKPGIEGCATCHAKITDGWKRARHKHLASGGATSCTTCHDPHAGKNTEHLLKGADPAMCLSCHKPDKAFVSRHSGIPVQTARCAGCHDPHGSDQPGMIYDNVHKPMAVQKCADCHLPGSVATKAAGTALCTTCHAQQVSRMLDAPRVHEPLAEPSGCLDCHSPHASRQRGLVKGGMKQVCGSCHADTLARQERSVTKHPPVEGGECTACHSPHSSDNALLLKRADVVQLCGTCHDWQKHSTHPIGAKLVDPRNKNLSLDCLSCHRAHGTENKHMNPFPTTTELCTQCHQQFKR
jgi:predicted CXXCH cytochrome family protein